MSRRRKPNGERSRSRSRPNFGYAGCAASSAAADPSKKKKKSAVTRSLFMNALPVVKWKERSEDRVPLLVAVAYIYR